MRKWWVLIWIIPVVLFVFWINNSIQMEKKYNIIDGKCDLRNHNFDESGVILETKKSQNGEVKIYFPKEYSKLIMIIDNSEDYIINEQRIDYECVFNNEIHMEIDDDVYLIKTERNNEFFEKKYIKIISREKYNIAYKIKRIFYGGSRIALGFIFFFLFRHFRLFYRKFEFWIQVIMCSILFIFIWEINIGISKEYLWCTWAILLILSNYDYIGEISKKTYGVVLISLIMFILYQKQEIININIESLFLILIVIYSILSMSYKKDYRPVKILGLFVLIIFTIAEYRQADDMLKNIYQVNGYIFYTFAAFVSFENKILYGFETTRKLAYENANMYRKVQNLYSELQRKNDILEKEVEKRTEMLNEKMKVLQSEVANRLSYEVKLKKAQIEIQNVNKELYDLSIKDGLTNIYNRKKMMQILKKEISRQSRYSGSLCVAIIDLDHFKKINDTYGHVFGDEVLKKLAEIFKHMLREVDSYGRYGGEEFLVILPETGLKDAYLVLNRVLDSLRSFKFNDKTNIVVTFSGGITKYKKGDTIEELIERADKKLYLAKEKGRDRIEYGQN